MTDHACPACGHPLELHDSEEVRDEPGIFDGYRTAVTCVALGSGVVGQGMTGPLCPCSGAERRNPGAR